MCFPGLTLLILFIALILINYVVWTTALINIWRTRKDWLYVDCRVLWIFTLWVGFYGSDPKCFLLTSIYLLSPSLRVKERISSCKFLLEKIPGEEVNKFSLKRSSCIRYTFNGTFGGYLQHDIKFTPIVCCFVFRSVLKHNGRCFYIK